MNRKEKCFYLLHDIVNISIIAFHIVMDFDVMKKVEVSRLEK